MIVTTSRRIGKQQQHHASTTPKWRPSDAGKDSVGESGTLIRSTSHPTLPSAALSAPPARTFLRRANRFAPPSAFLVCRLSCLARHPPHPFRSTCRVTGKLLRSILVRVRHALTVSFFCFSFASFLPCTCKRKAAREKADAQWQKAQTISSSLCSLRLLSAACKVCIYFLAARWHVDADTAD